MNKIKAIWLNRAEGPCSECGAVVFYAEGEVPETDDRHYAEAKVVKVEAGKIRDNAERQILLWGLSAPKDGGYDKTDFTVEWENDQAYAGRFDMEYGGTDAGESFWASLKGRIQFYAGIRRPSHFDDDAWDRHCAMAEKEGWKVDCEKMLNECEL